MSVYPLRVAKIVQETPEARSFILDVPRGVADKFRYRAGQFLTFCVPHSTGELSRCYSLSSSPEVDCELKVTVKRVDGGRGSNWFHDTVQEGAVLSVQPPAGRFVLSDAGAPLVLLCGGSGITPMISLMKSALATGPRQIRLFYANRDERSIIFKDELAELASRNAGRLEIIHHLDTPQGWTQQDEIKKVLEGLNDADVYLCGPGPFMAFVERWLLDLGVPSDRLRIERFEASAAANLLQETDIGLAAPDEIVVHFEGKSHKIPYKKGQTVLEASRAAGLNPITSCEQGFCGSCAAKCIKGSVRLVKNDVYSAEELAGGWILTCQAHCSGDVVEVTYDLD